MHRTLILSFVLTGLVSAQQTVPNTYGSLGGFGNVLYPGTGKPPQIRYPGTIAPLAPGIIGGTLAGRPGQVQVAHPQHSRRVIVPYPVFVGGYYNSGFDNPAPVYYPDAGQQVAPGPQAPVVIINQAYRPETANPVVRDYSDAQLPEPTVRTIEIPAHPTPDPKEKAAARAESERPTIFLIAFKDHTILPSLAYWVEGDNLRYVSRDGKPNSVSLSLVDREFSRQLNRERNVDFSLPE